MVFKEKEGVAVKMRWVLLISFVLLFQFYLQQAAPTLTAGDSGEFQTAAGTLSLAHAPSYPLFTLLGHSFITMIPFGAVSYRMNVFSVFLSVGTLLLFLSLLHKMGMTWVPAWLATGILGTSSSFWFNSLITEVFSLHIFWLTLLIFVLYELTQTKEAKKFVVYSILFSFVFGLGLGNHHTLVLVLVPFVFILYRKRHLIKELKIYVLLFLFWTLGMSVYVMLPVRTVKNPPLNWGQPNTLYKLFRVMTRKDYGTFSLALGEAPQRTWTHSAQHLVRFSKQLGKELAWPVLLVMIIGLGWGFREEGLFYSSVLILFILSGPLFYMLANLPFTSQSEGIMGRFFIMPTLLLSFGLVGMSRLLKKGAIPVFSFFLFLGISQTWAGARAHRFQFLLSDYGQAMLRTMAPGAVLFLDGGDDAFYSLAMLHFVKGQRADVSLHDRGGVVFQNPYGDDFRSLTKEEKEKRRHHTEGAALPIRPVYYSSMNPNVLPGSQLIQRGFLMEANPKNPIGFSWPHAILRSLYPLHVNDYRTRALACFFPYMKGRELYEGKGDVDQSLRYLRRSQAMGFDVDWLKVNLGAAYAVMGYRYLDKEKDFVIAEKIYRQAIEFDERNTNAQSNLGVALERQGRWEEAEQQYEKTARLFPDLADPVFNLAVLFWHRKEWDRVISYFEEVLKRNPSHAAARAYLEQARLRQKA